MISATAEQIDQTLTSIIAQNNSSSMNEQMVGMRNYLFNELLSPEMADEMAQWIESLSSSETIDKILKASQSAPDFTLTSASGVAVRLKSALKLGPAVIIFYRGMWCSFDNLYLKTIQEIGATFQGGGMHRPVDTEEDLRGNNKTVGSNRHIIKSSRGNGGLGRHPW